MMKLKQLLPLLCGAAFLLTALAVAAQTLGEAGLKVGMSYSTGKAILIKSGWKVSEEKEPGSRAPFSEFPEVSCGNGRDAICSVGFQKQRSYLALIVEKRGGQVIITGEY